MPRESSGSHSLALRRPHPSVPVRGSRSNISIHIRTGMEMDMGMGMEMEMGMGMEMEMGMEMVMAIVYCCIGTLVV